MIGNPPIAKSVTIDGERFRVAGIISSGDRGLEYQCANEKGQVVTVCHAPRHVVKSAKTSGRHIVYHW